MRVLNLLPRSIVIALTSLLSTSSIVSAHEGAIQEEATAVVMTTLEDAIRTNSIKVVTAASIIVLGFVILTVLFKNQGEALKKFLFAGIVIPSLIATVFLTGSTLYLNYVSSSGGPVHWHAQFEVWDCGEKLDLVDSRGFSNRTGTATLHEHGDDWVHLEGVIVNQDEATLGRFFEAVGGKLHEDGFRFPTNSGLIVRHDGDSCPDGSEGTLQVFVYQTTDKTFTQKKEADPASYIISPHGTVPPGDCIIIEFDNVEKERTDKLCEQYEVQILKSNLYGD